MLWVYGEPCRRGESWVLGDNGERGTSASPASSGTVLWLYGALLLAQLSSFWAPHFFLMATVQQRAKGLGSSPWALPIPGSGLLLLSPLHVPLVPLKDWLKREVSTHMGVPRHNQRAKAFQGSRADPLNRKEAGQGQRTLQG